MSADSKPKGAAMASKEQAATFRSFFQTYNKMSEICFNSCIWDFGTDSIRNREHRCVMRCTSNYMQSTKALGDAFAEAMPVPSAATSN